MSNLRSSRSTSKALASSTNISSSVGRRDQHLSQSRKESSRTNKRTKDVLEVNGDGPISQGQVPSPGSKENSQSTSTNSPQPAKRFKGQRFQAQDKNSTSSTRSRTTKRRVIPEIESSDEENNCEETIEHNSSVSNLEENGNSDIGTENPKGTPIPSKELLHYQNKLEGKLNSEKKSGTISKVKIQNFMCHDHIEIDWSSNLNFIVGENGSGKSAILSAIVVGLGAKANVTSRTKSVSELVKTGRDSAKIELTLSNVNGELPFHSYGSEIIIRRTVSANGVSSYKIVDGCSSRARPLLRTELDKILFRLGIQVNNPVTILNQEAARSFLKTKDPKDKYKFFFEGSTLATLERLLNETVENVNSINNTMKRNWEVLQDYKNEFEECKKLKKKVEEADRIEETMKKLSVEYSWSVVIFEENKREAAQRKLEDVEEKKNKAQEEKDIYVKKKTDLEESVLTSPEEMESMRTRLRSYGRKEQEIMKEKNILTTRLRDSKTKCRVVVGKIAQLDYAIQQLEAKVEDLSTRGQKEAEDAKKVYDEKMAILLDQKHKCDEDYKEAKQKRDTYRQGTESIRTQLRDLENEQREQNRAFVKMQEQLLQLKNPGTNKYAAYGTTLQKLIQSINGNKDKFKRVPHGPLGSCFKLKDDKWAPLIELVLGSILFTFAVAFDEDRNLLDRIIKSVYSSNSSISGDDSHDRRPTVIYNKAAFVKPFDASRNKATTAFFPAIMDIIEVEQNDFVTTNLLIDSCQIEQILLAESRREAAELLKDMHDPDFPRKCRFAYTLDFYKVTPDPRYRMEAIPKKAHARYVKSSSANQIRTLESKITSAKEVISALQPGIDKKKEEEGSYCQDLNKLEEELRTIVRKGSNIKAQIMSLTNTQVKPPDIASFMEELNDLKEQRESSEEEKNSTVEQIKNISPKIEEKKDELNEMSAKLELLKKDICERQELISNFQEKLKQIESVRKQLKILRSKESELKNTLESCELHKTKVNDIEKVINEMTELALQKGERVETRKSPNQLQDKIQEFGARLNEFKRLCGNRDAIFRNLAIAEKRYKEAELIYQCYVEISRILRCYTNKNANTYEWHKRMMGNVLTNCFQTLISSRGYQGRLIIEHDTRELFYFICPDIDANQKVRDALKSHNSKTIKRSLLEYASGLSGGERSFATICYIISMWQIMDSPFYMLDEFDVFMDEFNRKASQNALIAHASRFKGHQFFLLTPLELTDVKDADGAKILKMKPPARNK